MDEKLSGTKTEQNLINAFAGESQARNRYTWYSKIAKKEGYEQISEIFQITADNEVEHAKIFYEFITPKPLAHVNSFYPFELGTTQDNLSSAIAGETEEFEVLYKEAEAVAKEEGFGKIAEAFHRIRHAEEHHAQRFKKLYDVVSRKKVFEKDSEINWLCRKCGYVYVGNSAPVTCPNCGHPRAYFQVLCEKY